MPYTHFFSVCPEIAKKETRVVHLTDDRNEYNLPVGEYAFLEMFCDECDCRRAFLHVHFNQVHVASIIYGWEDMNFYNKIFPGFGKNERQYLKGPILDPFQLQSYLSENIMKMFLDLPYKDVNYLKRIEKHYWTFKEEQSKVKSKPSIKSVFENFTGCPSFA